MRIFNGTNSLLTLPLSGSQKLEIYPKSVSSEFMGGNEFLSMLVSSLSTKEIAIIVSGPYELNVCANIPTAVNYVVQTLDEAVIRFGLKQPETTECSCDNCKCEEEKQTIEPEPVENPEPETIEEGEVKNEATPTEEPKPVEEVAEKKKPAAKKSKKTSKK